MHWFILVWFFLWLVFLFDWLITLRAKRQTQYLRVLCEAVRDLSPQTLRDTLKEMGFSITSWRGPRGGTLLEFALTEASTSKSKASFWFNYFMQFHQKDMKVLLASGSTMGANALHTATVNGQHDIVKQIIQVYPGLLLQGDRNGHLPVMLALKMQKLKMVQILLSAERRAQLYAYTREEMMTFAESVCAYGSHEIVEWLLSSAEVLIRPEHSVFLGFHEAALAKAASNIYAGRDIPPRKTRLDQYFPSVLSIIILAYARPNSYKEYLPYFLLD